MNKLIIPPILAATVIIAGLFAFAPVEQASSVHEIILDASGLEVLIEEDVLLESDGTDVEFLFTATADTVVRQILIDNTPTCNPINGACTTFDEDVEPGFDGDTVDDVLCTIGITNNIGNANDPKDPTDRYTIYDCDSADIRWLWFEKVTTDGIVVAVQGTDNFHLTVLGENNLEYADLMRRNGAPTNSNEPTKPLALKSGETYSFIFDGNVCNDGLQPKVIDFIISFDGAGTLSSSQIAGTDDNCF